VTSAPGRRSERPDVVADVFSSSCRTSVVRDPIEAIAAVLRRAGDDDAVVVTGSLFLVGAVYPFFVGRGSDVELLTRSPSSLHA